MSHDMVVSPLLSLSLSLRPLGSSVRPTSIARVDKVTKCPAPRNLAPFAGRRQALLPAPRVLRDRGVLAGLVRLSSVQQRRGLRAKEVMLLPTEPSVRKVRCVSV